MLLSLSSELILVILEYVGCTSVVLCREVCSRLKDIISNDIAIQYRLELFAQNMVDCGSLSAGGMTIATRLEALKSFKQSSLSRSQIHSQGIIDLEQFPITGINSNLTSDEIQIQDYPAPVNALPDQKYMTPERDFLWQQVPGMVYRQWDSMIQFVQLPSLVRGIPLRRWDVDFHLGGARGRHIDGGQDLAVFIRRPGGLSGHMTMHFHRMSDGSEHPLAFLPNITLLPLTGTLVPEGTVDPSVERSVNFFAIYAQYIVVTSISNWNSDQSNKVILIDWKKGKVLKRWSIPSLRTIHFLDPQTFVCVLETAQSPIIPQYHVYRLSQEDDSSEEFSTPIPMLSLNCASSPISSREYHTHFGKLPGSPLVGTDPPFFTSPDSGSLIFSMATDLHGNTSHIFVTSSLHLRELVSTMYSQNPNLGITETQTLDVELWPNCSFTIQAPIYPSACSSYGMKALFSSNMFIGQDVNCWLVDFTRSWRKDAPTGDQDTNGPPSSLHPEDFVAHNFPAPLMRKMRSTQDHGRLILVEDGLIGVNTSGSKYGNVVIIKSEAEA